MSRVEVEHIGWHDDNVRVQDARRPFVRRVTKVLQVEGLPALAGLPSEQRMEAGINTLGYYTYPLLFYTAFPNVSLAQLQSLSLSGSYLFDHILCLDRILDHTALPNVGATLLSGMLQREALSTLHTLFPPDAAFWGYFTAYYDHFAQAILRERTWHHCLVRPYAEAELQFIYAGKPALGKACIAALALLDGSEQLIEPFAASHDAFYVGFQLFDDVQDWCLDYRRRHYSYPLTYAFQAAGWERRVEAERRPAPDEVADLLRRSGSIERTLSLAVAYLDKAEDMVGGMLDGSWAAAIRQTRRNIQQFRFEDGAAARTSNRSGVSVQQWSSCKDAPIVPVAPGWLVWLDHTRVPCIDDARIREAQQHFLRMSSGRSTVGEALCLIGLAVHASCKLYPDRSLAVHLGMSQGELEWCRRHDPWLDAMLALCQEEPVHIWTPDDGSSSSSLPGWVPPAVGRYLGHRLVENCLNGTTHTGEPTAEEVLDHYRHQLVA